MDLGVSNKSYPVLVFALIIIVSMAFSPAPVHTNYDHLVGKWNVTEESNEFKTQTYRIRIKQRQDTKILKDGTRCALYSISNFGGFGNENELKAYLNRGALQIDSFQVLNNKITVVGARGAVSEKHSSISWKYMIRIKSKEYQFKATFVEDK